MVAARLANMTSGARTDLEPSANLPEATSAAEAADMLNVSERSVRTAKKVQRDGSDELIEAVQSGAASDQPLDFSGFSYQLVDIPPCLDPFLRPHTVFPTWVLWTSWMPTTCTVKPTDTPPSDRRAFASFARPLGLCSASRRRLWAAHGVVVTLCHCPPPR
jgi:hypothetical protein